MFCCYKVEMQYSLHICLYVFTLAPYAVYTIFQLTSTLSLWGQSRSIHRMPLFGVPPGLCLEPFADTQTTYTSVFLSCIVSGKPASKFQCVWIYSDVAGWRCLGSQLELALLYPPHNNRLFLRSKPGAGSPLGVGPHLGPNLSEIAQRSDLFLSYKLSVIMWHLYL